MANLFLSAKEFLKSNDQLNYINYDSIREDGREFLRSDTWDFKFTKYPNAVYTPNEAIIKARLKAVNPQFPNQLGMMSSVIRQFQINQSTFSGTTSGSISMDFNDREDQAITAWLDDWRDKIGGRSDRFAFRKEDVVAEGELIWMNSSRKPIRIYKLYSMQLQDPGNGINPQFSSDDAQNLGEMSASWTFEHFELIWKNV